MLFAYTYIGLVSPQGVDIMERIGTPLHSCYLLILINIGLGTGGINIGLGTGGVHYGKGRDTSLFMLFDYTYIGLGSPQGVDIMERVGTLLYSCYLLILI